MRKSDQLFRHAVLVSHGEYLKHLSPSALSYMDRKYEAANRKLVPVYEPATSLPTHKRMDFYTYCEMWKERRMKCRKESTVISEYRLVEKYCFPEIKDLPIVDLTFPMIKKLLLKARYEGGERTESSLLTAFRSLVKYAIGDGLLERVVIDELYDRRKT